MTSISNANPAVVTIANSYPDGTNLTLFNTTLMTQIAGMTFTISNATGTDFELAGLDASGFANAATNVEVSLPTWPKGVQPQFNYITKIDRGMTTTLTFSTIHRYIPNMILKISVPRSFGMREIDQASAEILSITPYTVEVDIMSLNFAPFAFPASNPFSTMPQGYITPLFATVAPVGSRNQYNLTTVPFHQRSSS